MLSSPSSLSCQFRCWRLAASVAGPTRTRFSARAYQLERSSSDRSPSPPGSRWFIARTGAGISTSCPSPTPCGLGLGPTNPLRSARAAEALGMRQWGFSPHDTLLIPTFALVTSPHRLPLMLHPSHDAPLPPDLRLIPCFGGVLNPVTLSAHRSSTSELLRTLSRVAASKPTSWLSGRSHILTHLARTSGP